MSYFKKLTKNAKTKSTVLVGSALIGTSSFGAVTAPDTTQILIDVGVVFTGVMGVYVVIFGLKKVLSFFR